MKRTAWLVTTAALLLAGCSKQVREDPSAGVPPPAEVESAADPAIVKVDHAEQFALADVAAYDSVPELSVTGVVSPDVSRSVPVISMATGRVVEIHARLGDEVKQGQLLLKVRSTDIASAFGDYRKAVVAEQLTRSQLERAKTLFEKGAIASKDVEAAQSAENSAKVDVETTTERLHVLGADPDNPTGIVPIYAPVAGVITDQQVTNNAGVQAFSGANPFTISDLSNVWIVCDVYENDLAAVQIGEASDIALSAYPGLRLSGRIGNIGAILDPNLHTAKVRVEAPNTGRKLRVGMFAIATFHGQAVAHHALVPASALLHLHDRDWAFVPAGAGRFRRVAVAGGRTFRGSMQEVVSGLRPGDRVVRDALTVQNTVDQQ